MIELVSTFVLIVGFVDDLRSRKIHNKLLLGLFSFLILYIFTTRGFSGLLDGLTGSAVALALTFPLVWFRVLGGGDMKLFAVFGFTSAPADIVQVYLWSILAGAFIGLVRAALGGQLLNVLRSTAMVAVHRSIKPTGEHNIPYSAALLIGWLTHLTLIHSGGGLL